MTLQKFLFLVRIITTQLRNSGISHWLLRSLIFKMKTKFSIRNLIYQTTTSKRGLSTSDKTDWNPSSRLTGLRAGKKEKRRNIICSFRDKEQNEQTFHPRFLDDFYDDSVGYQLPLNTDLPDGVIGTLLENHRTLKMTIIRTEIPRRKQAKANYSILDLNDYMVM